MPKPTLFEDYVVVVDLETSGLSATKNVVVELAAVLLAPDGTEVAAFSSLIKPDRPLTEGEAKVCRDISGITPEMLEWAPPTDTATIAFEMWLWHTVRDEDVTSEQDASYPYGPLPWPLTSFNVSFDQAFVDALPIRGNIDWTDCIMRRAAAQMKADGVELVDRRGREKHTVSLADACAHFGVDNSHAHRALADARAAAGVLVGVRLSEAGIPRERFVTESNPFAGYAFQPEPQPVPAVIPVAERLSLWRGVEQDVLHDEDLAVISGDEADTIDLDDLDVAGV